MLLTGVVVCMYLLLLMLSCLLCVIVGVACVRACV